MTAWDRIPSVEIVEAEDDDDRNIPMSCEHGRIVFGPAPIEKGFKLRYVSKVMSSAPLCWRRNADPRDETSQMTKWYICRRLIPLSQARLYVVDAPV